MAAVVSGIDLAVATSATYERGDHIWGVAGPGIISVTVTGDSLGFADAYATALFAAGPAGLDWFADLSGYEAMFITDTAETLTSSRFPFAGSSVRAPLVAAP